MIILGREGVEAGYRAVPKSLPLPISERKTKVKRTYYAVKSGMEVTVKARPNFQGPDNYIKVRAETKGEARNRAEILFNEIAQNITNAGKVIRQENVYTEAELKQMEEDGPLSDTMHPQGL